MAQKVVSGSRNVALVGAYSSGKTTLLESMLSVAGAISRKGRVDDGNTLGDGSPEARDRTMTVELNAASAEYGGIRFTFVDCPGSVELQQETWNALVGVDAAVVVCEADPNKVLTLSPLLQFLDSLGNSPPDFHQQNGSGQRFLRRSAGGVKDGLFPSGGAAAVSHSPKPRPGGLY
jgi:elongation factor G